MAIDRVLLHVRRGPRVVKRAVDPADVYFLEADGGDTLVRLRGARRLRDARRLAAVEAWSHAVNLRRVRELRPRDDGEDWEVKLEPPVNRVLPVARDALARPEAAFAGSRGAFSPPPAATAPPASRSGPAAGDGSVGQRPE